ncbi:ghrelin O-acyltransferase [Discoglossus pictus]
MKARYLYLLAGGLILACASMGAYAVLIFTPALGSMVLLHTVSWQSVHRLSIMISSLMLLTQKVTSLALDIHERKVKIFPLVSVMNLFHPQFVWSALVSFSYFLFFPALLGGPLCSFMKFQQQVQRSDIFKSFWLTTKCFFSAFFLQVLRAVMAMNISSHYTLMDCRRLTCVYTMWSTALLFKLTYYSHWLLDESVFHAAGFEVESGQGDDLQASFSDTDIWTLETTHKISVFTRTWNKSTAKWLRRLMYQKCKIQPLLLTFAFSAWWHGLYPGQIFGFLFWAAMVKCDYKIHTCLGVCHRSVYSKYVYKVLTWVLTQLIIAFIMMAIEMRNFVMVVTLVQGLWSLRTLVPYYMAAWAQKVNNESGHVHITVDK